METGMTLTEFVTMAKGLVDLVKSGIELFMAPPLVWFVAMGALAAGIGMAKRMIPKKRAK